MSRKFVLLVDLNEDMMRQNAEVIGVGDLAPGDYLEHEFAWVEQRGFSLLDWRIIDEDDEDDQRVRSLADQIFRNDI